MTVDLRRSAEPVLASFIILRPDLGATVGTTPLTDALGKMTSFNSAYEI
jgi:hypothetical protein